MTAIVSSGGGTYMLIPENMDQAMRLADMMARAKMVPQHLRNDVGSCLMVVEQSMRWKASPFAVAQCTANVGGKLVYEGKLIAAILPSCGAIIGELDYKYHGDPKNPETLSVTVSGMRASDGVVKTLDLDWVAAKTSNKYWTTQPEQQLCYAGARVWARRWTPGPLLGIYAPEEFDRQGKYVDDPTIDITPEPTPEPVIVPDPTPDPPKRPSTREWLDVTQGLFHLADTLEAVEELIAGTRVQTGLAKLTNGALEALQEMIINARRDAPTEEEAPF